jgi:ribosomal protein S18 acetylase RimI-like enzyme
VGPCQASAASDVDFSIAKVEGDQDTMKKVAKFMLNSFWLPQVSATESDMDPKVMSDLITAIQEDLMQRYGSLMGKRQFDSYLLTAMSPGDNNEIIGVVGIDVTLLNKVSKSIFSRDEAEKELTNALSSMGPKQRREYKGATIHELVPGLLPPEVSACALLSNLAVGVNHRRKGIAQVLCQRVDEIVKEEWGFESLSLRVEASNSPARKLYEESLNFKSVWSEPDAMAYRVDVSKGAFDETTAETLLLSKDL